MGVRAARWIWSLVVCGLAGVAVRIFGMTLAPVALAEDRGTDAPGLREAAAAVPRCRRGRGRPGLFQVGDNPFGFTGRPRAKVAMVEDLAMEFEAAPGAGAVRPAEPKAGHCCFPVLNIFVFTHILFMRSPGTTERRLPRCNPA